MASLEALPGRSLYSPKKKEMFRQLHLNKEQTRIELICIPKYPGVKCEINCLTTEASPELG